VNFRNNILSIGTGKASVLFYDIRMNQFLKDENPLHLKKFNRLKLQIKGGWIVYLRYYIYLYII